MTLYHNYFKVVLLQKVVIDVKLHAEREDLTPFQLVEVKVDFVLAYHIKKEEKTRMEPTLTPSF